VLESGGVTEEYVVGKSGNTAEHVAAKMGRGADARAGGTLGSTVEHMAEHTAARSGGAAEAHVVANSGNTAEHAAAKMGRAGVARAGGALTNTSEHMAEHTAATSGGAAAAHLVGAPRNTAEQATATMDGAAAAHVGGTMGSAAMRGPSFVSRAGAAIAISRRAASGRPLFPPAAWSPSRPLSPIRRPAAGIPLPRPPSGDVLPNSSSRRPGRPDVAPVIVPTPLYRPAQRPPPPSNERDVRDDLDEAIDPTEFLNFSPHQVGAAIATFAGAQLSHVRQLELYRAFTLGAVEGNVVGIVAVQEDIHRVAKAVMTFYRRGHDGRVPYGTECRVLRFLRRMR